MEANDVGGQGFARILELVGDPANPAIPGRRPKEAGHAKELARQHTAEAIRLPAAITNDDKEPAAARVWAAEAWDARNLPLLLTFI